MLVEFGALICDYVISGLTTKEKLAFSTVFLKLFFLNLRKNFFFLRMSIFEAY